MEPLVVSQIVLWIVVVILALAVAALARQIGVLHERVAPLGALSTKSAVEVGQPAPQFDVIDLAGRPLHIGGASPDGRSQFLLFVSPSCPMCKKLLPVARSFARSERRDLALVLMGDGDRPSHEALIAEHRLDGVPFALAPIVGINLGIGRLPHAVLIDAAGIIRSKGIVNSREHLESLLVAQETGYASMQDYLRGNAPGTAGPDPAAARREEDLSMMLDAFDRMMESASRQIAQRSSRRSVLARLGTALIGGALLPILPVDRSGRMKLAHANEFAKTAQTTDPTACNYWRNCSSDGYLCACCGGTYNECPPGSHASPTSWIATCVNPDDNQAYLIAYQDCCGKDSCGQCACLGTEGEMPSYRPELNNDIVWCFGAPSMVYHCSSQVVIGKA